MSASCDSVRPDDLRDRRRSAVRAWPSLAEHGDGRTHAHSALDVV